MIGMPIVGSPGRRDRHKQLTREAIEVAAGGLFGELGFERTTVAMIAARADVSERTFFRYFESKDDLLLSDVVRTLAEVTEELRRRPRDERPMRAVAAAVAAVARRRGGPVAALGVAPLAALSRPRSAARLLAALLQWESQVAAVLLERSGDESEAARLRAAVAAAATTAGLRCTVVQLVAAGDDRRTTARLEQILGQVFDHLDAGCAAGR
jgi:AcrR family transcriptional regulator